MKKIATLIIVLFSITVWGQKEIKPTDAFLVTGQIKNEITISLEAIEKLATKDIPDLTITNHKGESRSNLKQMKGVLLKDLLKDVELKEESPRRFSEFYFTFIANDNYKVVYSWDEIFNSSTGDNIYIIISIEGKPLQNLEDRILVITPTDFKTGRRYIKSLSKIVVNRVE